MQDNLDEKFSQLRKEFDILSAALYKDLLVIQEQIKIDDNQTWRRSYTKAMFSAIESQISSIESHIKVTGEFAHLALSEDEEVILYNKSSTGKKPKKLSFAEKSLFILNLFSEVNYSFLKIDNQSVKWGQFKTFIKIRNRITHPKHSSDVDISDEEILICEKAFNDFQTTMQILFQKSGEALEEFANRLSVALNGMKNNDI